jgi:hypothetical protein
MTITQLVNSVLQPVKSSTQQDPTASSKQEFSNILEASNEKAEAQNKILASEGTQKPPTIRELMDRTGLNFVDASEMIYGVVGSNTDTRDWASLMDRTDLVSEIKSATAKMYQQPPINRSNKPNVEILAADDTLQKSEGFAVRLKKDSSGRILDSGLKLIDGNGMVLRDAGVNKETIKKNADLFGCNTLELAPLSKAAGLLSETLQKSIDQLVSEAGKKL